MRSDRLVGSSHNMFCAPWWNREVQMLHPVELGLYSAIPWWLYIHVGPCSQGKILFSLGQLQIWKNTSYMSPCTQALVTGNFRHSLHTVFTLTHTVCTYTCFKCLLMLNTHVSFWNWSQLLIRLKEEMTRKMQWNWDSNSGNTTKAISGMIINPVIEYW